LGLRLSGKAFAYYVRNPGYNLQYHNEIKNKKLIKERERETERVRRERVCVCERERDLSKRAFYWRLVM
jgi:hypothetical protein